MATEEPKASESGRWQFSLRTLFLLVALVATLSAWLGAINQRFAKREQAYNVCRQVGKGNVHTDIGFFSIAYDLDFSDNLAVTDSVLEPLRQLEHLRDLNLANTNVSDASVQHLRHLSSLRLLDLRGTKFSEAGCKQLEALLPDVRIHR